MAIKAGIVHSESGAEGLSSPTIPTRRDRLLTSQERQDLAIAILAQQKPVAQIARENQVSRPFLYRQAQIARQGLSNVFESPPAPEKVLFYLPITDAWLDQAIMSLTLDCHSPFRGIQSFFSSLLDIQDYSLGSIYNVIQKNVKKAMEINRRDDLSGIREGLHDEIFQAGAPILVGLDAHSCYCYLLAKERHRDEITWGVHLLDLMEQGWHPQRTIADFARGLRAGQSEVCPEIPCDGDVFHALKDFHKLTGFLEHRAISAMQHRQTLEAKMERAKQKGRGNGWSKALGWAREKEREALDLAADMDVLGAWLQEDILALVGPGFSDRKKLLDFVVEELRLREDRCPHRIAPVRRLLENQGENLLAFAQIIEAGFSALAEEVHLPVEIIGLIAQGLQMEPYSTGYWIHREKLLKKVGSRLFDLETKVEKLLGETSRASSLVENFNSRIRSYFFLRRHVGDPYLDLLRFFLNHHRFERSEKEERKGKSPKEILTGQPHAHWLELLGYTLFRRTA